MIQAQETDMRHLMPLLAAAASVLSAAPAYADLGDQLAKLLPIDGAVEDLFGGSVPPDDRSPPSPPGKLEKKLQSRARF